MDCLDTLSNLFCSFCNDCSGHDIEILSAKQSDAVCVGDNRRMIISWDDGRHGISQARTMS